MNCLLRALHGTNTGCLPLWDYYTKLGTSNKGFYCIPASTSSVLLSLLKCQVLKTHPQKTEWRTPKHECERKFRNQSVDEANHSLKLHGRMLAGYILFNGSSLDYLCELQITVKSWKSYATVKCNATKPTGNLGMFSAKSTVSKLDLFRVDVRSEEPFKVQTTMRVEWRWSHVTLPWRVTRLVIAAGRSVCGGRRVRWVAPKKPSLSATLVITLITTAAFLSH